MTSVLAARECSRSFCGKHCMQPMSKYVWISHQHVTTREMTSDLRSHSGYGNSRVFEAHFTHYPDSSPDSLVVYVLTLWTSLQHGICQWWKCNLASKSSWTHSGFQACIQEMFVETALLVVGLCRGDGHVTYGKHSFKLDTTLNACSPLCHINTSIPDQCAFIRDSAFIFFTQPRGALLLQTAHLVEICTCNRNNLVSTLEVGIAECTGSLVLCYIPMPSLSTCIIILLSK